MGDLPPEVRPLARAAALLAAAALLSGAACGGSGGGSGGGGSSTAAQATGSAAVVADGEIRVLVYGDSLWDRGGDPDRCDLCERLPEDVRITNYARSGAEIWPSGLCDGVPSLPDPGCRNGADRALDLAIDDDPRHDVCGAEVAGRPTCLLDNADHDVLLVQFGTNDVRKSKLDASRWSDDRERYASWLDEIVAQRPAGMACALVVPPPLWSRHYEVYNARLAELAALVEEAAARHGCAVADLFHLYLDIEAALGPGATLPLYRDCAARGSPNGDCVHYARPRPSEPADEIAAAIRRAAGMR